MDPKDKKVMKSRDSQRSDVLKMKIKESRKTATDLEELTSNLPREEWNMSHVKGVEETNENLFTDTQ